MEKCSIVIPSYNDADNLKKCLDSLLEIDYPPENLELIVVDNNSTDNTAEIAEKFPQVVYLKEARAGASHARNKGISRARYDILAFLDSDTIVTADWLRELVKPFLEAETGAVGGAIYPFNRNNLISRYLGVSLFMRYHRYGGKRLLKGYPSCNLAVRKALVSGGFDTESFSTYGEDKDICCRILAEGYNIVFSPQAIVEHRHPETLSELLRLMLRSSEGRAAFGEKYPTAPDILIFNLHVPLLYLLTVILAFIHFGIKGFVISLLPALIYLIAGSIISLIRSRDFLVSIFIKPVLDVLSLYTIYVTYQCYRNKLKRR